MKMQVLSVDIVTIVLLIVKCFTVFCKYLTKHLQHGNNLNAGTLLANCWLRPTSCIIITNLMHKQTNEL